MVFCSRKGNNRCGDGLAADAGSLGEFGYSMTLGCFFLLPTCTAPVTICTDAVEYRYRYSMVVGPESGYLEIRINEPILINLYKTTVLVEREHCSIYP